jgi:Acetyl/propionyl-CoA carboxylase, alpha subunit
LDRGRGLHLEPPQVASAGFQTLELAETPPGADIGSVKLEIRLSPDGPATVAERSATDLTVDGQPFGGRIERLDEHTLLVHHRGQTFRALLLGWDEAEQQMRLRLDGRSYTLHLGTPEARALARIGKQDALKPTLGDFKAPMPGLIRRVDVQPGQTVEKGDPLLVLEAMKMENVIKAPGPGVVKEAPIEVGQTVEKNALLIRFE